MDRFQQTGACLEERFLESPIAGDLKRYIVRINRVHLAVIKVDVHVYDTIAGQDSFRTSMLDTAFNRREKNPIDALSGKRIGETDPGIAGRRCDSQQHLSKLPRAA